MMEQSIIDASNEPNENFVTIDKLDFILYKFL